MNGSSYRQIQQRTWNENVLFSVLLELTYRCNLDCFICYNDKALEGVPLTLVQYRQLLDDLAEMGALSVTLSGGEPLAHPDFFAIGAHARERGFVVRIKSNAHALNRERIARIQSEIDPFIMEVSLHGATAETHDRQTRVPGSFVRLQDNLAVMQERGLRFRLNAVLSAWNEHESEAMYELADRFGVKLQFDMQVTPRDDGDREPQSIGATPEGMARLLQVQSQRRATSDSAECATGNHQAGKVDRHCGAGSATIAVDPYGNVYPCVNWRRPSGSLHDQGINEIWNNSVNLKVVRDETRMVKKSLGECKPSYSAAGFCQGLAERLAGRSDRLYDDARQRLALLLR